MDIIDYGLSFLAGKWTENKVRFWVESRTRIIDERESVTEDYYQAAACKSEDTFADKDLFYPDNYDFTPIFGPEWGVIFRRRAWLNPNYRSVVASSEMWAGQVYKLKTPERWRLLETTAEIRKATHEGLPLVAQTEIWNERAGLRAIMEYPVKTMNIHDEKDLYQVDTGPIAWPDLSQRPQRLADTLRLAYAAFNAPHFCDFVIEEPTPIVQAGRELTQVYHYSRRESLPAKNRLYAIG